MRMIGLKTIVLAAGLALAVRRSGDRAAAPRRAPAPTSAANRRPRRRRLPPQPTDPMLAHGRRAADGGRRRASASRSTARSALQPQVTPNGRARRWFHDRILLPIITIISLFVLLLLIWVRLPLSPRRQSGAVARPRTTPCIEIVWTLAPVLILVGDRGAVDRAARRRSTSPRRTMP